MVPARFIACGLITAQVQLSLLNEVPLNFPELNNKSNSLKVKLKLFVDVHIQPCSRILVRRDVRSVFESRVFLNEWVNSFNSATPFDLENGRISSWDILDHATAQFYRTNIGNLKD